LDEAIGIVAAGRDRGGRFAVGGDFLASEDAIERLAARASALGRNPTPAAIAALVDEVLGSPGVALDGVRTRTSFADVLVRALALA
jgi:hypothetical protein